MVKTYIYTDNCEEIECSDIEDTDSGLVADASDVLPDEETLDFDYELELDLSNENFGELSEKLDNNSIESNIEKFAPIKNLSDSSQHVPQKNGNKSEKVSEENSGKVTTFSREQARQWRRKRILNSQPITQPVLHRKPQNLEPLLPLPEKLKPIGSKGNNLKKSDKLSKKLSDPLLGGEKIRSTRGPLPMKLRALPESFWKEPKSVHTSSLAGNHYSVLPPLFSSEESNRNQEVLNIRPVTPPDERKQSPGHSPRHKKKWEMKSAPNTELLFSLFDSLENKVDERLIVRRGRPKKNHLERIPPPPGRDKNDDPCIVDALADKLFPELSLHQKPGKEKSSSQNFAIVRIGKGERTIEFPAIQVDQNYPAILNELVTHM